MYKFLKSASDYNGWFNDDISEICLVGRSNVGKSSLVNALANNSKLAITSNSPGRTQLTNFYDFNQFRLVDLPGYGFANVSHDQQKRISLMLEEYLNNRQNILAIFQVCDINVITEQDIEISKALENKWGNNHFVILNKIDKVSKSFYDNNKDKISKLLNINLSKILIVSAEKRINIDRIWSVIRQTIKDSKK